jgi:hypothetical protein
LKFSTDFFPDFIENLAYKLGVGEEFEIWTKEGANYSKGATSRVSQELFHLTKI